MVKHNAQKQKPTSEKKEILIVDDHALVREGLKTLIQAEKDFVVTGEAEDACEALDILKEKKVNAVIVDLGLKGMSGLELIKNIKIRFPQLPILVVSMYDESIYAERALRAGAKGYIMKNVSANHIVAAIRLILSGKIYVSEEIGNKILDQAVAGKPVNKSLVDSLSDRELDVFHLIGKGFKPNQIAKELNLGVKTIESYREQIKLKLNFDHSAKLTQYAIEWVHSEHTPPISTNPSSAN